MKLATDNRAMAMVCIVLGVGLASAQDAVVKYMSSGYPAYETLLFRCVGSLPVIAFIFWKEGRGWSIATPLWPRVCLRGVILAAAYLCFVLAIAAIPIANAVAIYFTMPFFVAGLAGPLLHERVRLHRWLAIIAGFIGVLIMVRPGAGVFEPASLLALGSAFGYAVGQMLGRPLSQKVPPIVIATWQNFIYAAMSLAIGVATAIILAVIIGANWAYNLGLKSTPADGLTAAVVFGLLPAYAASTLPSHPLPTWNATAATALLGVGAHFATVLPDLAADRATGVNGLAQQSAARWGVGAVRGAVLVLVSAPSVLLLLSSSRPWFALAGLSATVPLAVIAARGAGRVPLWAVVGIGAVDAVVFGVGGSALT